MNVQVKPLPTEQRWSAEDDRICIGRDTALTARAPIAIEDQRELERLLNLYGIMPTVRA